MSETTYEVNGKLTGKLYKERYILDHNALSNRDLDDQHPISAIAGLAAALENIQDVLNDHSETLTEKVDKVTGKGLSTNDFTNALKTKLNDIETGAEVNIIESIKLDGAALTPDENRVVDIPVDDTLEQANTPADSKAVGDKINELKDYTDEAVADLEERKFNYDGYSDSATVANAEQIIATEAVTDTEPYNFRKTGGPNDVGDRVYDTLVGGSVVWNQLVDSGATEVTVPNGHKYYANINGTKSIGASTGTAISINDSTEDNVIDLTAALGSTIADYVYSLETATAGAGVAWVRRYLTKEYFAYCEPHFEHVQTSAKVTVGFNQFDKNASGVQAGKYLDANGAVKSLSGVSLTDYIPVIGGTSYYWTQTASASVARYWWWFDENKAPISGDNTRLAAVRVAPSNACYLRVSVSSDYWDEFNVNIHGDRDGEYEPYRKRTYPLDSSLTLRGIPKLDSANRLYFDGDVYQHDGTVTRRYGFVDLGTLTWNYDSSNTRFFASADNAKSPNYSTIMCPGFTTSSIPVSSHNVDKCICAYGSRFYLTDFAYTNANELKTSLNGVYIVYELATPATETAEPYQHPMVVDPLGTEEFVDYAVEQGDRDVKIPCGHTSKYPADLRGKLQRLPSPTGTNGDYIVTEVNGKLYLKPYVG